MGEEDRIQQECFIWFWNTYKDMRKCLFAVPNGGKRDGRTAKIMKATGTVSGVSDLILLYNGSAYCLEAKTSKGRQSTNQLKWQEIVEKQNIDYYIFRSLEEFKVIIKRIIK